MLLAFETLGQQIFWSVIAMIVTPLVVLLSLAAFGTFSMYTTGQKALGYSICYFIALGLTLIILRFVSEQAYIVLLGLSVLMTIVLLIRGLIRLQHRKDEEG